MTVEVENDVNIDKYKTNKHNMYSSGWIGKKIKVDSINVVEQLAFQSKLI